MAIAVAFIAINLVAIPGFLFLQERATPKWNLLWLFFLLVESLATVFYTLFNFGGAFGPGVLLFFSPCLSVPLSLLFLGWGWRRFSAHPNRVGFSRRGYLADGLAIVIMQTAPMLGNYLIGGYCDQQAMRTGDGIVLTLQRYHQDHGEYPPRLEALVPAYLAQIPTSSCLYDRLKASFDLVECSKEETLLTIPSANRADILRYNLQAGKWSGVSFLDGVCRNP